MAGPAEVRSARGRSYTAGVRQAAREIDLASATPVCRDFYTRDSRAVAPELLNKVIVRDGRAGRIVEVEAYCGPEDPASHAFRGPTQRNVTMFGPPGHLYVYFTYGMHWCANAVCGEEGEGVAVLLRALAPLAGIESMRVARKGARRDRDLTNGPAKLCEALGITGADDGVDLTGGDRRIQLVDDGVGPPTEPGQGLRVGISVAVDNPWRWWVQGDPHVSR